AGGDPLHRRIAEDVGLEYRVDDLEERHETSLSLRAVGPAILQVALPPEAWARKAFARRGGSELR
ncbi:MAG: hypothetical protein ACK4HD_13685, partial [Pannonibacter phragmitetus]